MADSLTKDMDTTVLRSFLRQGQCVLHDIDEILKQRADKKIRQKWYEYSSADVIHFACFSLGSFERRLNESEVFVQDRFLLYPKARSKFNSLPKIEACSAERERPTSPDLFQFRALEEFKKKYFLGV